MPDSSPETEPVDLFVSYAHADNGDGWLTHFVTAIKEDFHAFSKRPLRVFFDLHAIRNMQDWELRILKGLKEAKVMLAVLSPAYIASPYCQKEWRIFVEHEIARAMLHEGGIANLYYITVPGVLGGTPEPAVAAWLSDINRRQMTDICDAREWRKGGREALQREDIRRRLRALSQDIDHRIQLVNRKIASPTTVPPYNRNFVGRIEDLRRLRHTLEENPVGAIVGVQGIGGIGKTELAFAYAHAYADTYPGGRYLIPAEGIADMREVLLKLDGQKDSDGNTLFEIPLDDKRDLDRAAASIRNQISSRGRCLLLLDNVDKPALLAPAARDRVLPDRRHLLVLVTTREDPSLLADVICLPVDSLETPDALRLLEQHRPFGDDDEMKAATAIVNLLGGHPLACEVVAIHLREHPKKTCAAYLSWMRENLMDALGGAGADPKVNLARHPLKLLGPLLGPTIESLHGAEKSAIEFASLMHPDGVPLPWLRELVQKSNPESLPPAKPGRDDPWDETVARLLGLRLLSPANPEFRPPITRIHRLVQQVIHAHGDAETNARLMPQQQRLVDEFVESRAATLREIGHLRENQWEIQPVERYALHRLTDPSAVERAANIANLISGPMTDLAVYQPTRLLLLRAIEVCVTAFGPDDHRLAPSLSNLALVEQDLGNLPEAKRLYLRAIEIETKHFDPDHPNLAISYANLAQLELAVGNRRAAKELAGRSLAIFRKRLPSGHPHIAMAEGILAAMQDRAPVKPEEVFAALEAKESAGQAETPQFAIDLNNYALLLRKLGRFEEAANFLRRAIGIEDRLLPPDHPKRAHRRNNLAVICMLADQLDVAERVNAEAWSLKTGRHDVTSGRILVTRIAIRRMRNADATQYLGQLRTLLEQRELPCLGEIDRKWDAADVLKHLRLRLPPEANLFTAIIAALNEPTAVADLDQFDVWRSAPAVPLETPWPPEP